MGGDWENTHLVELVADEHPSYVQFQRAGFVVVVVEHVTRGDFGDKQNGFELHVALGFEVRVRQRGFVLLGERFEFKEKRQYCMVKQSEGFGKCNTYLFRGRRKRRQARTPLRL